MTSFARRATLALVLSSVLLAGCGTTVAGQAEPVVGAGLQATTAPSSSTDPTSASTEVEPTVPTSLPDTSGGQVTEPSTSPSAATDVIGRPISGGQGAGVVPPELAEFYNQKLDWTDCTSFSTGSDNADLYATPGLECSYLILPLNYDDPSGPTVEMAVLRSKATGPDRVGSLLFNPGGPGASGMGIAAQFAAYGVSQELSASFDLVGFDTRGTGSSRPLIKCSTDAERDKVRATQYDTASAADMAAQEAATKQQALNCAERTGVDEGIDGAAFLATVGSVDVVKDMDVLRSVLGDEKLSYVGYSYGTLLGTLYAEAYPANVRALILDGAVDNSQTREESLLGQAKGFQGAFEDFAADCAQQAACVLGQDPAVATAVFQTLTRPLLKDPAPVDGGRVLTYNDAITGVIQAMYSETLWPGLRSALLDLSNGNGTALMALADSYEGRDADGKYSALMDGFTAIRCVDDERFTDPKAAAELSKKYNEAAPFADSGQPPSPSLDICAYWPVPPTLKAHTPKADGLPKVMVISTTGDPATPYQAGVDLAKDLNASLVTIKGTQHTGFLSLGNTCVDTAGVDYLIRLTDPVQPLDC
ncbi:alpha/beta fold hydrolase [Nakamurella silvestris]|nr:alpha/beta fold hydrolase [Nakamurella silvestris]